MDITMVLALKRSICSMNILFFQNIVSPHQMPYIQHLPTLEGVQDVVVIVPEVNLGERDSLGWDANKWLQTKGVNFVVAPSKQYVEELFRKYEKDNTWCLFSGINAFPMVVPWFRSSLKYKVKRGIITEPPYVYKHPLWQHSLRFALKDWIYVKDIDKVFVMGDDYLMYYKLWSKHWEVIPFMYCTEWRERSAMTERKGNKLKILYVGNLSHRKNVECLLKANLLLNKEEQNNIEIGIVGDGEQRPRLEQLAGSSHSAILFFGTIPMEKIPHIMEQYDVLVLPSLHDGWGAVVNEALMLGLYVICSNHCGAKYLLKNHENGSVFSSNNILELKSTLLKCIDEINSIREGVPERISWSRKHIHGDAVANYFYNKLKV
jgi:glycosyltransferase involved in cell wall biosynthesis